MNVPSDQEQAAQSKKLQTKIAELENKTHLPDAMVALVAQVSRLQYERLPASAFAGGRDSLPASVLEKISAQEQRSGGAPILPGRDFPLDMPQVEELAAALLRALPEAVPLLGDCVPDLEDLLAADPKLLPEACAEILDPSLPEKSLPRLGAWAKLHPEAPHFLRFVATSACMPSLVTVGRILGEEHDAERVWSHGHCPVCGNLPLLGRLVDKEGRRMHDCSFCGFEYRAPRLGCPFCLEPETEGAEYLASEDEPGYLLTLCKACNTYFKLGDFREFDRPWFPLLDDLGSLTLDIYAVQLGYKRLTFSGWGF